MIQDEQSVELHALTVKVMTIFCSRFLMYFMIYLFVIDLCIYREEGICHPTAAMENCYSDGEDEKEVDEVTKMVQELKKLRSALDAIVRSV